MVGYKRENKHSVFVFLAIAIIVIGIAVQIVMQIKIASGSRTSSQIEGEIATLNATIDNLEHSINQYHDLDRIGTRAQQLGMEETSSSQIRFVTASRELNTSNAES